MALVNVTYPGIVSAYSGIGTCSRGPHPDTALVSFLPQAQTPSVRGNLTFSHGGDSVTWTNALLDRASLRISGNGHMTSARIEDRRADWRYTVISGVYNERDAAGEVISSTEKTPRELATLLLNAMGESGYSVSALPNDSTDRPLVNWMCANPAMELDRLCQERGCEIVLKHSTNTVAIVVVNSGAALPSADVQSVEFTVDLGQVPNTLRLCMGPTVWQARFKLARYGLDTDGQFKPIDDLSYAPSAPRTWDDYIVGDGSISLATLTAAELELATAYVGKLYKIDTFADGTLNLPGTATTLNAITQCLPLNRYLLDTYTESGELRAMQAYVSGNYRPPTKNGIEQTNNTDCVQYEGSYSIWERQGFVLFQDQVVKVGAAAYAAPDLYLTCTFSVRDNSNHQYIHYTRDKSLGGTGTAVVRNSALFRSFKVTYSDCETTDTVTDNKSSVDDTADALLTNLSAQYATRTAKHVKYRSIKSINCDGLTSQVTWKVHRRTGANTWAAQNCEPELGVLRTREKRQLAEWVKRQQEDNWRTQEKKHFEDVRGKPR